MLALPRKGLVVHDRALALIVVVALVGCGSDVREAASDPENGPILEMRLAHYEPATGLDRVEHGGEQLYVESDPVVTDADFETVQPDIRADHVLLNTTLTSDAAFRLESATAEHIGKPMAIFWDSELISAPVVQDAIGRSGNATIVLDATAEEAESIVGEVRRRWPAEQEGNGRLRNGGDPGGRN